MENVDVKWAQITTEPAEQNPDLDKLLATAHLHYTTQIDWFHRHKDAALKYFAGLIAAELALLTISKGEFDIFVMVFMFMVILFAPLLGKHFKFNCERAYTAWLEANACTAKVLTAMGLTAKLLVLSHGANSPKLVLPDDEMAYVPRYIDSVEGFRTTDDFVKYNSGRTNNTLKSTKKIIDVVCWFAVILAAVAIAIVATRLSLHVYPDFGVYLSNQLAVLTNR